MPQTNRITVLGLGNVLCGDDGFGSHAAEILTGRFCFPDNCNVVDGGTQGQLLYGIVEETDRLLLIDAIDFGLSPGTLAILENDEIPTWLGTCKLSSHQGSFAEVLALASLKNVLTPAIRLIGFQAATIEFGSRLSPLALESLPKAVEMAVDCLRTWGITPLPRTCHPNEAPASIHRIFTEQIKARHWHESS